VGHLCDCRHGGLFATGPQYRSIDLLAEPRPMPSWTAIETLHRAFLSDRVREKIDKWTLIVAILAFVVHLLIIFVNDSGLITFSQQSQLLTDPIAAAYTPFSFILVYEVYLLVYYLPFSFTVYVGKQYEIITLIIIRRSFKDLANIELSSDWFRNQDDLFLTGDLGASLLLFGLIYLFNRIGKVREAGARSPELLTQTSAPLRRFIRFKKAIASCLVPVLLVMAVWSFGDWLVDAISKAGYATGEFKDINSIFFEDFFRVLIIVDVLLLLISLFTTDQFHKTIRNSGFIISTILIRLSFSVDGLVSTTLVVVAVIFGLAVLWLHNCHERLVTPA
jgi:hypothetical protein